MAKKKTIDLEKIPTILQKAVSLIDRELDVLLSKQTLNTDESKILIAYTGTLSDLYKDYRAEVLAIKKELKELPKEDLQAIIKAESN